MTPRIPIRRASTRETSVLDVATGAAKPRAKQSHPEAAEQRLFVRRWRMDPRTRDLPASSIPSGAHLTARQGALMKADGLERGLPDWMMFVPEAPRPVSPPAGHEPKVGLALEFKAPGGGRVSPEQKRWHDALRSAGWQVAVVESARDAWHVAMEHLGVKP